MFTRRSQRSNKSKYSGQHLGVGLLCRKKRNYFTEEPPLAQKSEMKLKILLSTMDPAHDSAIPAVAGTPERSPTFQMTGPWPFLLNTTLRFDQMEATVRDFRSSLLLSQA